MDVIRPTWTEELIERAVAWMAVSYRRLPGALNLSTAQGLLAERLVSELLGDGARVSHHLEVWRRAMLPDGLAARQMTAANNPDWLLLDPLDRVTGIVEVKAVRGDTHRVEEDHLAYRAAWTEFPEVLPAHGDGWVHRITRAWLGQGPRLLAQLSNHLDRLIELAGAGLLTIAEPVTAMLFVPDGEQFVELPRALRRHGREFPLELHRLPDLSTLQRLLERAWRRAFGDDPPPDPVPASSQSSIEVLRQRLPAMRALLPLLETLFGVSGRDALDRRLARLLIGAATLHAWDDPSRLLSWRQPERLLERLGSVAPTVTAQVLFDATAGRNGSCNRVEREAFFQRLETRGSSLTETQAEGFLGAVSRLRMRLRNKGWPVPSLEQTLEEALQPDRDDDVR